jgi:PAS domain S-box-containing protein
MPSTSAEGDLLRSLVEAVDDAVSVKDAQGRYLMVNAAAAAALGRPASEIVGRDDRALLPPAEAERVMAADRRVLECGETVRAEQRVETRQGPRRLLSTRSAYRDATGKIVGVLGIARDVTARERSEDAQAFLADASQTVTTTLDAELALRAVAESAVPHLADRCTVDLLEDGQLRRLAVAGRDSEGVRLLEEMRRRYPIDPGRDHPTLRVVRTGRSQLVRRVTDAQRRKVARDDEHLALLRRLGVVSTMCVPLAARGRVLGALTLSMAESGRHYDEADLAVAEELARRAALAVDNALLYEAAQAQASRLGLLAAASVDFAAATLDLPTLLETIVRRVADTVGDGCAILLGRDDGRQLDVGAVHHPDEQALALARDRLAAHPSRTDEGLAGEVAATKRPRRLAVIPPEQMRALLPEPYWPYVGRYGVHSMVVVPLTTGDRLLGMLVAWRDVSKQPYSLADERLLQDLGERAALAVGNARLYRQAQEAIRARDEFLSIASHELRTPVTSIKGFAQVALRAKEMGRLDEERLTRSLQSINRVSDRLAKLIEDLLDVSRLRTERLRLSPERIDLASFVNGFLTRYADQMDDPHRLKREVPRSCAVAADPVRLEQVLLNLLDNAVKYSPDGGEIRVAVRCRPGEAIVSVADRGVGIPPAALRAIFEPFGRAVNAERLAIPGMGLGLSICRGIVERLGGRIWAESEGEDKGATVSIALPRATSRRAATRGRRPRAG